MNSTVDRETVMQRRERDEFLKPISWITRLPVRQPFNFHVKTSPRN